MVWKWNKHIEDVRPSKHCEIVWNLWRQLEILLSIRVRYNTFDSEVGVAMEESCLMRLSGESGFRSKTQQI
jgi:hypothetical protein